MTFDDIQQGSDDTQDDRSDMALVDLEFATLRRFREEMAPFLNYEGFFVRTEDPFPRGTAVRFRFLLPEGFALAEGTGVVAWTRTPETHKKEDPGMALWFDDVNQQSKEVVDELVDFHIATGGKAFDLGRSAGSAGDIPTDALAGPPPAPPISSPEPPPIFQPEPDPDPEPEPAAPTGDVLPEWLSEVAQDDDEDFEADDAVPAETIKIDVIKPDPPKSAFDGPDLSQLEAAVNDMSVNDMSLPRDEELEISLMPQSSEPDSTPMRQMSGDPGVTMSPHEKNGPLRDIRWKPLGAVAVVLGLCTAILLWVVNRTPDGFKEDIVTYRAPSVEQPAAIDETAQDFLGPGAVLEEDSAIGDEGVDPLAADMAASPNDGVAQEREQQVQQEAAAQSATGELVPADVPPAVDGTATKIVDAGVAIIDNKTQIGIRGNGQFLEGRVKVSRLKDPDRVWIRIQGIQTFYRPNEILVDSKEVERVRIGHHPEENPPSIYIVIDLADSRAQVHETWLQGDTFRVAVGIQ